MLRTKTDTPWTARPSGDGDGLWTVEDANGGIVFFGMEEDRAKLFASAPELLAALKAFIDAESATGDANLSIAAYDRAMEKAAQMAKAAIAKAEGSAQ